MADDLQRIIRLDVDASAALGQLNKIEKATGSVDKSMQTMSNKVQSGFDSISKAVGVVTAAFATFKSIKAVTDAGDQIRNLQGSFEALLGSAERASDMLQEVFSVVQNTGVDMSAAAESTQRLAIALGDAGATNAQIAQLTENFVKIGRIGGTSMNDISGALVQFTQALASGKLQGDELKSIMERMPLLGKQIANEMGVLPGQLKALGSEGKITSDILVNAILNPTKEIEEQFAKLPLTMEQSFNQAAAQATQLLATFDTVAGISNTIAILIDGIAGMLASVNKQTGDTAEKFSIWESIATDIGNAFRGVVIVVNTLVGGLGQLIVALKGIAEVGIRAIQPAKWGEISDVVDNTWQSMKDLGTATMETNKRLALGEQRVQTNTKAVRDYQTGLDALREALKKQADAQDTANKKSKGAKPPVDEWNKWIKSLQDAQKELDLAPVKLEYLNKQLAILAANGDTTSTMFKVLKKAADELAASLDPVAAALQKVTAEALAQDQTPKILEAMEARLVELAFAGKAAGNEFRILTEQVTKMRAAMDRTGATALVDQLKAAEVEAGNLQAKFDEMNKALENGTLKNAAAVEAMKNNLLGVTTTAEQATDKTKTLAQSVADLSGKFVVDFSDKIIDSIGDVETSFGDMIETFIKQIAKLMLNSYVIKFLEAFAGTSYGQALGFTASAKAQGAAFNAQGIEYMAQGGIVSRPTMFTTRGGGLGVMGEAGAEAIVPLKRTAGGDLGVAASPVNVQVNNYTEAEVKTSESTNVDGQRMIKIEIRRQVREALADGSMDRTMRSSYGVTRQPAIG
jgi:tape measure domain-containing protein